MTLNVRDPAVPSYQIKSFKDLEDGSFFFFAGNDTLLCIKTNKQDWVQITSWTKSVAELNSTGSFWTKDSKCYLLTLTDISVTHVLKT